MATLHVKVVPGASRNRIAGKLGDAIKVQVSAPPEKGKANAAVIDVLATALNLKPSEIELIAGHTQPRKTFNIPSLTQQQIDQRLGEL